MAAALLAPLPAEAVPSVGVDTRAVDRSTAMPRPAATRDELCSALLAAQSEERAWWAQVRRALPGDALHHPAAWQQWTNAVTAVRHLADALATFDS
jgi:hypothetical protein